MPEPWAPEVADSPYAPGDRSPEAIADRQRRIAAEADRRHTAGTYGQTPDHVMRAARATLGPDPHTDPVAEILGHPSDTDGEAPGLLAAAQDTYPGLRSLGITRGSNHAWSTAASPHLVLTDEQLQRLTQYVRDQQHRLFQQFLDQWVTPLAKAATTAIDNLTHALEPVLDQLPEAPRQPSRTERRRHGAAATCPKHGPTRGGTCMTCARRNR